MENDKRIQNHDREYDGMICSGFAMLLFNIIIIPAIIACLIAFYGEEAWAVCLSVVLAMVAAVLLKGYTVQQPNQSRVVIFFGRYRGTIRQTGFWWINPFNSVRKVSLRIRNLDIAPIKVNDKTGNPVMIGMVLVWKVSDTYRAVFDIDTEDVPRVGVTVGAGQAIATSALENFVNIQSDAALREVTGHFAYDEDESDREALTLRSSGSEINELLEGKLNERLSMAGVEVVEARINYLAYAPEIAAVMLRRQQASAIISAREKIVEGAVSMVKMALERLEEDEVVRFDEERKAAMVSNLLVVLCGDEPAQPVVNAGSIYQ